MITDLIEAKKKELISIQDVVYEILEKIQMQEIMMISCITLYVS